MKRTIAFLALVFALTGCAPKTPTPTPQTPPASNPPATQPAAPQVSAADAETAVNAYLEAWLRRDQPSMVKQVSPELAKNLPTPTSNPHPMAAKIMDTNAKPTETTITVLADSAYTGQPTYSREQTTFTVNKVDNAAKITKIESKPVLSLSAKGSDLMLDQNKLISLADLPKQVVPQAGKDPFGIGDAHWGPAAIDLPKSYVAVTAVGTHGFIGLYDINQKKLIPVDLLYGGGTAEILFDEDGFKLYAIANYASGESGLRVYSITAAPNTPATVKLMGNFNDGLGYSSVRRLGKTIYAFNSKNNTWVKVAQ